MEVKETKKRALLAASMAGLLAMTSTVVAPTPARAEDAGAVPCYGVNACKGTGDCGGKGHSCAGQNGCKGEGYISLPKDTCLKINGGSLTPQA
jgi:uncharacterized membrane protein